MQLWSQSEFYGTLGNLRRRMSRGQLGHLDVEVECRGNEKWSVEATR